MKFRPTKLPRDAATTLRLCPIQTVKPYAVMIAPVYVYMQANEKFVAIKSPLDFFTDADLKRLAPLGMFFLPAFIDGSLVFREKARSLRKLLDWSPKPEDLGPAPFELSDAVLRALAPLWGLHVTVESFFVTVFANELCAGLAPESLARAREQSVPTFERALMVSSWTVFIALHCGWTRPGLLDQLRAWSFDRAMGAGGADLVGPAFGAVHAHGLADAILASGLTAIGGDFFGARGETFARRMFGRLERVKHELRGSDPRDYTIFGPEGIADGG